MADRIRFVLNDQPVELSGLSPMTTLLDWLRDHRGLKGTKEGCAEGDCGACTVVLERADGRREAINACIALVGQIDGQAVRTVEGLRRPDGAPHPVQTAMADADATQCGFCTPGFVMSAYAFAAGGEKADLETIHDALAGNLCRCTGYRPIVEAMTRIAGLPIEPARRRAGARRFGRVRLLPCAALARRASGAAGQISRGAVAGGRHRSRSSGQPVAQAAGRGHPRRARAGADRDRGGRGGDHDRRRRDLCAGHAAADRPLSGAQDLSRAAGLAADPHHGHDRRQYRHRLADRRHAAGAAGARDEAHARFAARHARPAARGFLPRLSQDRAGGRRGDPEPHAAQAAARRAVLLRQAQQAARPGHFHRGCGLSPAHREGEDRERAYRLRRHGGDAQAREPCRAGAEGSAVFAGDFRECRRRRRP